MKTSPNGSWIEKAANSNAEERRKYLLDGMTEISGKIVDLINGMHHCDLPIIIASLHHLENALRMQTTDLGREIADDLINTVSAVSGVVKVPKREE